MPFTFSIGTFKRTVAISLVSCFFLEATPASTLPGSIAFQKLPNPLFSSEALISTGVPYTEIPFSESTTHRVYSQLAKSARETESEVSPSLLDWGAWVLKNAVFLTIGFAVSMGGGSFFTEPPKDRKKPGPKPRSDRAKKKSQTETRDRVDQVLASPPDTPLIQDLPEAVIVLLPPLKKLGLPLAARWEVRSNEPNPQCVLLLWFAHPAMPSETVIFKITARDGGRYTLALIGSSGLGLSSVTFLEVDAIGKDEMLSRTADLLMKSVEYSDFWLGKHKNNQSPASNETPPRADPTPAPRAEAIPFETDAGSRDWTHIKYVVLDISFRAAERMARSLRDGIRDQLANTLAQLSVGRIHPFDAARAFLALGINHGYIDEFLRRTQETPLPQALSRAA